MVLVSVNIIILWIPTFGRYNICSFKGRVNAMQNKKSPVTYSFIHSLADI